jgi:predicted dehydrogenase
MDLALWLFGDLKIVDVTSAYKIGDSEISASFMVTNSNGLAGRFEISQRMPNYRMPEFGFSVECVKGKLDVNNDRLRLTSGDGAHEVWYRHDLQDNVRFSLGETEYYRENQEFVDSVMENRACEPNFDTASKVDYMIDQVKQGVAKL